MLAVPAALALLHVQKKAHELDQRLNTHAAIRTDEGIAHHGGAAARAQGIVFHGVAEHRYHAQALLLHGADHGVFHLQVFADPVAAPDENAHCRRVAQMLRQVLFLVPGQILVQSSKVPHRRSGVVKALPRLGLRLVKRHIAPQHGGCHVAQHVGVVALAAIHKIIVAARSHFQPHGGQRPQRRIVADAHNRRLARPGSHLLGHVFPEVFGRAVAINQIGALGSLECRVQLGEIIGYLLAGVHLKVQPVKLPGCTQP